jgi:hypothetical protein
MAAWPFAARAHEIATIGIIDDAPIWEVFRQSLRDLGYLEGQNIAFEYRHAGGRPHRLTLACAELVRRSVDLIATFGTPATLAPNNRHEALADTRSDRISFISGCVSQRVRRHRLLLALHH